MGILYSTNKNIYDWKPELPDLRDNIYKHSKISSGIPSILDFRRNFKEYTQDYGSSTATSISAVLDSYGIRYKFENSNMNLSCFSECIKKFKIIDKNGEEYDIEEYKKNNDKENKKRITYKKIYNYKNQLKQTLYEGHPIIFGYTIYESFESEEIKKDGIIQIPKDNEKILGGLCGIIVGYNSFKDYWIVKHNLGKEYNDGYFYLPTKLISKNDGNQSYDFWVIS
jgi:hypothetical protein